MILTIAALGEAATGVVLLVYPPIVTRLLFAGDVAGAGLFMSRIAGISLIGLGVACWPSNNPRQTSFGMLTYSTLAMLYLMVLGIGGPSGVLLWPGVVVHAVVAVLLLRACTVEGKTKSLGGALHHG